jgi:hypothetical protein
VLHPKTVVEFGFFRGHSAFNFLCALEDDARIYSYDLSDESATRARDEFGFDPRLTFLHQSQSDFDPSQIGNRSVDLVFLDGAHDLAINIETFKRLLPSLSPTAIIAIHDTGLWERSHLSPAQSEFAQSGHGFWVSDTLYAHQPEERAFVNWIVSNHPQFGTIHLHSTNTLRHGLSLVQRQAPLPNDAMTPRQNAP